MTSPARVIVADPPWLFGDPLPGAARGAAKHYPCLSLPEIARFPLPPLAPDCFLFLWYVTSMVDEARFVCRAWGFEPTGGELIWVKTTRKPDGQLAPIVLDPLAPDSDAYIQRGARLTFGMGRTVRNCDERCLIARRGRPKVASRSVRSVFFAPTGQHSTKPDRFYELVEQLSPGPYVELFARRQRGALWTCFGDELATGA